MTNEIKDPTKNSGIPEEMIGQIIEMQCGYIHHPIIVNTLGRFFERFKAIKKKKLVITAMNLHSSTKNKDGSITDLYETICEDYKPINIGRNKP